MRAQRRMVRVRGAPWQCRALGAAEGGCEAVHEEHYALRHSRHLADMPLVVFSVKLNSQHFNHP